MSNIQWVILEISIWVVAVIIASAAVIIARIRKKRRHRYLRAQRARLRRHSGARTAKHWFRATL